jgi:hypothetical protein
MPSRARPGARPRAPADFATRPLVKRSEVAARMGNVAHAASAKSSISRSPTSRSTPVSALACSAGWKPVM